MKEREEGSIEGMQCPACKSLEPFEVEAIVIVEVRLHSTEDTGSDYAWYPENWCVCVVCEHEGTLAEFTAFA